MLSRRQLLQTSACGFGSLALNAIASREAMAAANPLAARASMYGAKAKRVIFLFMAGGVSHVDSFDHKPLLDQRDGEMLDFADARSLAKTGMGASQRVMKSLWEFKQQIGRAHV